MGLVLADCPRSVPELKRLPRRDRRRIVAACYWRVFRHWQTWLGLGIMAGGGGLSALLGPLAAHELYGTASPLYGGWWLVLLSTAIGGGAGGVVYGIIVNRIRKHYIREHLRRRGLLGDSEQRP
jgi:hypothetical protein